MTKHRMPPTTPGWYWMLSRLTEIELRERTELSVEQRYRLIMDSIRVCQVDYKIEDGVRQLCAIHPGGNVPMTYHQDTMWGPSVEKWDVAAELELRGFK